MTAILFRLVSRGEPELACDDDGLTLGPIVLAKVKGTQCWFLSPEAAKEIFSLAYGPIPDAVIQQYYHGLVRVTRRLASGDGVLAGIEAVLLGFPHIVADRMEQLAQISLLHKYNPDWENEPRVPAGNPGAGEWTSEDGEFEVAASGSPKCDGISAGCQTQLP